MMTLDATNCFADGDIVLTGPPNSGKTTLIQALKSMGYLVAPEIASELIQEGLLPWEQPERFDFQRWTRQLKCESQLPAHPRPAFLDRGLFDTVAYRRAYDQPLPDYVHQVATPRYSLMLLLAPCPWVEDGIRYEAQGDIAKAEAFQSIIAPLLEQAYSERGVPVVRVPLMSPEQRLRFVLDAASRQATTEVSLVS